MDFSNKSWDDLHLNPVVNMTEKQRAQNTIKSTLNWRKKMDAFCLKFELPPLKSMNAAQLFEHLPLFFGGMIRNNGEPFDRSSIQAVEVLFLKFPKIAPDFY